MEEEIERSDDGRVCTDDADVDFWEAPAYAGGDGPCSVNQPYASAISMEGETYMSSRGLWCFLRERCGLCSKQQC